MLGGGAAFSGDKRSRGSAPASAAAAGVSGGRKRRRASADEDAEESGSSGAASGGGSGVAGAGGADGEGAAAAVADGRGHGVHVCVCRCKAPAFRRLSSKVSKRRRALAVMGFTRTQISDLPLPPASLWVAQGHFRDNKKGAPPTFRWPHDAKWQQGSTNHYELVSADAPTPATVRTSVQKGLSSLKQLRGSHHLRQAEQELVAEAAAELRQALRGNAELERELEGLRQQVASARERVAARGDGAPYGGGGGHSPRLRFAAVDDDTEKSLAVFGLGDRSIKSLAAALDFFGLGATKHFDSGRFRSMLEASNGVDGTAHSAASTRFSTFRESPTVDGGGGGTRVLATVDMVAHTLYILKHDITIVHAGWLFNISPRTSSRYFIITITALDKFFVIMYPPLSSADSRLLTPISAKDKVGDASASLFAADAAERQAVMPHDGGIQAMYFSNYKKVHTHKLKVVVHVGGFPVHVSDAYTGFANDDDVLVAEWDNILRYVPRGSIIYVDKGYHTGRVLELALKAGITILAPPRKVDNVEFTSLQLQSTQKVANIRIVVETVIGAVSQRWRFFRNGRHPAHMNDLVSAAYRVCFFLENSFPPRNQGDTLPLKSATAETAAAAASAAAAAAAAAVPYADDGAGADEDAGGGDGDDVAGE